jgi:hypothetical protein
MAKITAAANIIYAIMTPNLATTHTKTISGKYK